ncbi:MAG: DUF11 domain-containing protein [Candidatus Omnitrophica bacterium]|nr:DUF11 domain-containing protein [Candidatus Omnitrophota bacterium]
MKALRAWAQFVRRQSAGMKRLAAVAVCSALVCGMGMVPGAQALDSEQLTMTITIQVPFHLHDGTTLDQLMPLTQATDGSGEVTMQFKIQHAMGLDADVVPGSFEYQVNGSGWMPINDADITGTKTNLASAADMSGPTHTLVWDNTREYIDNGYYQDVQVRFKLTAGGVDSEYGVSPLGFNVDNLAPQGMADLVTGPRRSTIECFWSEVEVEHSWAASAHYEIWYGENQADVENRAGTAQEWDPADDPALSTLTTDRTTLTGLTPLTTYYVKIWAIDDFGNEASLSTATVATLGDGTIDISLGEESLPDRNVPYGGQYVPMIQLKVVTGPAEHVDLTEIAFQASGTGHDVTHLFGNGVKLYRDLDQDGKLDATDVEVHAGANFDADNGEVTFNGFNETLSYGSYAGGGDGTETHYFLVTYNFAGLEESKWQTFQTIFQQASDAVLTGVESGANITATGTFPVEGGIVTLVEAGEVTVEIGPNTPPDEDILNNLQYKPVLQLRVTETSGYEDVMIQAVTIEGMGTGHEKDDLGQIRFYFDNNNNGIVDDGDQALAYDYYETDDGRVIFTMGTTRRVSAGGERYLLMTYNFNGNASAGETFTSRLADATDVELRGVTSNAYLYADGVFPIAGNTMTVVAGELLVEIGASNPGDSYITNDTQYEEMIQLQFTETSGRETMRINQLVFRDLGTGDLAGTSTIKMFVDHNENGIRDPEDGGIVAGTFDAGTGECVLDGFRFDVAPLETRTVIITYNFNGTAPNGETFQATLDAPADVAVRGLSSDLYVTPDGAFPFTGGTKTISDTPSGRLYLSKGEQNPPRSNVRADQTGVVMMQFNLRADDAEDINLQQIVVTHQGSGTTAGIANVEVYHDVNSDGELDGGDVLIGENNTWAGDENTVSFAPAYTLSASAQEDFLIVYDFAGTAPVGDDFRAVIDEKNDLAGQGDTSLLTIYPSSEYPVLGNLKTVADRGTLTVQTGENNPDNGNILNDETDVEIQQLKLSADMIEDITVDGITFTHEGTGNPSEDVQRVRLFRDVNSDGRLDGGDVFLAQETAWAGNAITVPAAAAITAGTTEHWLLVYDMNGTADEMETFRPTVQAGGDFQTTGVWSGLPVNLTASYPLAGAEKRIVATRAYVDVSLGPNTPPDEDILNNPTYEPMMQIELTEYSGFEDAYLRSITFQTEGSGNELEHITEAKLYWDNNNNGIRDGDESAIGKVNFDADDGTITFNLGTARIIRKNETRYLLLTYDFNRTAPKDATFKARIDNAADVELQGRGTGIYFEPDGVFPMEGATKTVVTGEILAEIGENNPNDNSIDKSDQYVEAFQIKLTETSGVERVDLGEFIFKASGTGDDYQDISEVRLYWDNNGDGLRDGGDLAIATGTFDADDGEAVLNPGQRYLDAGEVRYLLVTLSFRGTAEINETFQVSIESADKMNFKGDVTLQPIEPIGAFPLQGATLTVATDPSGYVYDSLTGDRIDGVTVTLRNEDGTLAAVPEANPQLSGWTGNTGEYQFTAVPGASYYLEVIPPAGYTYPSEVVPRGSIETVNGVTENIARGSHGDLFDVGAVALTIHLPIDKDDVKVIKLEKDANKEEVVVGDIVTYTLTIENMLAEDIDAQDLYLTDRLPPGFKYISGTTLLDGNQVPDPAGTSTRRFNIGTLSAGQTKTLSYQLVVGSGVEPGQTYENRAAVSYLNGAALSNTASDSVEVTYDPIFDLSIVIGKVFHDRNEDGIQQPGEEGIPDVKIATEDGLYVVTDKDGKYHIDGLKPQTKLLKVDSTTLPEGTTFTTENPRVARLTRGLLNKTNFGVQLPNGDKARVESEEGAPYLEVKVVTEPTIIEPQLTVVHTPSVPQLNLKGDALDSQIVFRINTNYPDFIDTWELEIFDVNNRVTPFKVFRGTGQNLFDQLVWDGRGDDGELVEPESTYIYTLTVEDALGNKDTTAENQLLISSKETVSRTEKADVAPEEFFSNQIATQTIPVERTGAAVTIQGTTAKESRVTIGRQTLGVVEGGEFSKTLILPQDTREIKVTAERNKKKSVYTKKLSLSSEYFFLVALGEAELGKASASGNIAPVRDDDKYRSGYYFDGRLAYYLKAKVKGKYLITSSFDSERQKDELKRFIDPDKYYPVYGDSSSVVDDTNTRGRFYLLVEWDKSYFTWGNYSTDIKDVDLASYSRTFYGAKLHYQSVATTKYGDPDTIFIAFAAETDNLPAHNELLSTGGSLYYLQHENVEEGTEQVVIEVRDKDTGLVLNSYEAQAGVDYEIDYDQGRIIFYKAVDLIADSEDLIGGGVLLGNPIYIVVDYEYQPDEFVDETTYGVRAAQQITDHLKLGTTYIKDEQENGFELRGYDFTFKFGNSTEFKAEYAESESNTFTNAVSYDGGLTFVSLPSDETLSGDAVKIDLKTDLGELFGTEQNKYLVQAYYQDVSSGFSSQGGVAQQGTEKYGIKLTANLTKKDTVSVMYDYQELEAQENLQATDQVGAKEISDYTLQYKRVEKKYTFTGEYRHRDVSQSLATTDEEDEDTIAAKLEYNLNKNAKVFIEEEANIQGPGEVETTVGGIFDLTKRLQVRLEQMFGTDGQATSIGIDSQIDSKTRMFTTYKFGNTDGEGRTSSTTVGTETLVDKHTTVTTAQEYRSTSSSTSSSQILGVDWDKEEWDLSVKLEQGEIEAQGETTKRTILSIGAGYTQPDKLKLASKIEMRFDRGDPDKNQYLFQSSLEYKFNQDWTVFTRMEYSRTHNRSTEKTEAEFKELVLGAAFRPVEFDKLNLLAKLSYIEDMGPASQEDTASITEEKAFVAAIEGAYDVNKYLQIVQKVAYKWGEERVGTRAGVDSATFLWVNRFNYHVTSKWDIGVEYRMLDQDLADDRRTGFLVEISRHINDNFQVGVGYNFTDFDDDLSRDDDYQVKGFFIRFTGKY